MSQVEILEGAEEWRDRYARWKQINEMRGDDVGEHYPWVENRRAPFRPARRALPMLNLALVTSAGAYVDGTEPFDTSVFGGDTSFREIPVEVGPDDLKWTSRGYAVIAMDTCGATRVRARRHERAGAARPPQGVRG